MAVSLLGASGVAAEGVLRWRQLAPIPDPEGFAGSFAGVHNGALIVAGGANFPDARPWEGGAKVWHDSAFVLERPDGEWKQVERFPKPLGYGVSITTPSGVACLGGSDSQQHHAECFLLRWEDQQLTTSPLPPLPKGCANAAGAMLDGALYVAGGQETPGATAALKSFWRLDLSRPESGWQELKPWPGPARMLATVGAQRGSLYLFGGAALEDSSQGEPRRRWLRDAYCYKPGDGWRKIADLPRAVVAAPSPAPAVGQAHLVLLGGDDGAQVDAAPADHRGFPRDALAYDTITDTWTSLGEAPFGLVTTPAVRWEEQIVIPGGERRPGVRSNQVWAGEATQQRAQFGLLNYGALGAYLLGMIGIGWVCAKRNKNTEDYFKASGRIPWWAAGLSIYATMLSSLTFMAIPAKAYATDWTFLWANVPILLLAPVVIRYYLPFFCRLKITSAYEYLELRFNRALRLYASAAFILFQLGRQAIVLLLPSLALATVCNLDVRVCILIMGILCAAYTVMGGIEGVIWTDVAQSAVLLGGAALSLVVMVLNVDGGLHGLWETAADAGKLHLFNWTLDPSKTANAFWVILVGNLFVSLVPYTSDQAVIQRYLTTQDESKAARAIWTNALLAIPSTLLFFAIGAALFVFYKNSPQNLDPTQPIDAVFPVFIVRNLPAGVAGVVVAGIFAASQSTVSSSLNSVVTAIMTDFWGAAEGSTDERRRLRLARWLTALNGAFATAAALLLLELDMLSLWDAYFNLVGLAGSGLAGLFALGIFTRRATAPGAIIGVVTSAAALYAVQQHTDIHFFLYAMIGFATCFAVGLTASIALPWAPKQSQGLTIFSPALATG